MAKLLLVRCSRIFPGSEKIARHPCDTGKKQQLTISNKRCRALNLPAEPKAQSRPATLPCDGATLCALRRLPSFDARVSYLWLERSLRACGHTKAHWHWAQLYFGLGGRARWFEDIAPRP